MLEIDRPNRAEARAMVANGVAGRDDHLRAPFVLEGKSALAGESDLHIVLDDRDLGRLGHTLDHKLGA